METQKVNIVLNTEEKKDKVLKSDNSTNEYIIMMNDHLQYENRELREKVNEQTTEISTLEEDCDKSEKSIRYMKGLLKNMNEIRNNAIESRNLTHKTYLAIRSKYREEARLVSLIPKVVYYYLGVLFVFMMFLMLYIGSIEGCIGVFVLSFINTMALVLGFLFNGMMPEDFMKTYEKENELMTETSKKVKELDTQIKKTEDSIDFINETIDNI